MGRWWSAHTHSQYSVLDAMTPVAKLVRRAAALEQPALGLTDHGNMGGVTQLYTECRKAGIKPFPGVEAYLIDPEWTGELGDKQDKPERYHFGMLALNQDGYQALVKAVSLTHTRPRFDRFPRFTWDDLIALGTEHGDGIAVTSGCFFGYVQQAIVHGMRDRAAEYLDSLAEVYPHLFVELQHHRIDHHDEDPNALILSDDEIVKELHSLAGDCGLPVVATADSHYLVPHDQQPHSLMKKMVFGGAEDAFPGDGYHLPDEGWVRSHYPDAGVWQDCLDGLDELLELNELVIPALDTYRPRVPKVKRDAQAALTATVNRKLKEFASATAQSPSKAQRYRERVKYELEVIEKIGFADYFLLWDLIVKWCRSEQIAIEARGSANGSLVCFLLGITQVDPVKFGVIFDRFLSIDRIKPPDIDMDIEDVSRHRLIHYLKTNFDLCAIGTWGHLGSKVDEDGDEKGSALVTFKSWAANVPEMEYREWRQSNKDPNKKIAPTDKQWEQDIAAYKHNVYAALTSLEGVREHYPKDYPALRRIIQMGSVLKSYGTHAGGLLLSGDDLRIEDWIPTMLVASSDTTVSMYDMDDVEQWGLIKLDVLGQRSLTVLRLCQEKMGRADPTDFSWIPEDDQEALRIIGSGHVKNGVFHQEGYAKAIGYRKMRPRNLSDVIVGTALFMPGAMDHGQTDLYLERRKNVHKRERVTYPHPVFKQVLGKTYGALVFQEQTLNIMRGLGIDILDINMMFKIVKDSGKGAVQRNVERLAPIRAKFEQACINNHVLRDKNGGFDRAWEWITGIVAYAFNQAHATGYGIRTYRFAYLKAHYPLEFHTALLEANAGTDKEDVYLKEVRRLGIPVLKPHVNKSAVSWTLDRPHGAIRKGIKSIAGIGVAGAADLVANAPYSSVADLCTRCLARAVSGRKDYLETGEYKGTLLRLKQAGALKGLAP